MKEVFLFAIMAITGMAYTACNDEWKDELYTQVVSFRALRGGDDIYDAYMRYKADGMEQCKLPVIVSGSTLNASNVDVRIDVDNDTLSILNKTRFTVGRNGLWFKQLPEHFYSFPSPTYHTPSGRVTVNYTIDFNLSGLDLNEQWILPSTVELNSSYTQNMRKGWYKALLNINPFNDYPGRCSAADMSIYIDGTTSDPVVEDNRLARVVDDHSIFFYAGTAWEEDVNRHRCKVIITFGEGTPDAEGNIIGPVTITAGDPANGVAIEQSDNYTYPYRVLKRPTKPYLERRIMTLYLDYRYSDIMLGLSNPIRFHCKGNMTMERQYSILIPDKEQTILWWTKTLLSATKHPLYVSCNGCFVIYND